MPDNNKFVSCLSDALTERMHEYIDIFTAGSRGILLLGFGVMYLETPVLLGRGDFKSKVVSEKQRRYLQISILNYQEKPNVYKQM
jgi:hypothetical protein